MFTLFFSPGSCSRASHIVLEESGLPYTAHRVNFAEGEQPHSRELGPREPFHVPAGLRHRMIAIEDTDVLEVSTTELDDVVRLEDRYGRTPG